VFSLDGTILITVSFSRSWFFSKCL